MSHLIYLALLLSSCSSSDKPEALSFQGTSMTMPYQVIVDAPPSQHDKLKTLIASTFEEIDRVYNKWNPHSELSQINRAQGNTPLPLSQKLEKLFTLTDHIVLLTEGRFDPTVEPVQALWKRHFLNGTIPSSTELENLKESVGWNRIQFSNGQIIKPTDATSFDFGGIAKGLGVDLLIENFNHAGFTNAFVSWGGEIRASGKHPEGRSWKIFISRLEDENPEHAIAHLDLNDQAIATSGDYLQNWKIADKSYFHIIDPKTLEPLQMKEDSIASASVVAQTCALADGLATAAMLFSTPLEAESWAESIRLQYPEISFWIISRKESPKLFSKQL